MNKYMTITILLTALLVLLGANVDNAPQPTGPTKTKSERQQVPDVNTIVNRANLVAYYQGKDGKAKAKMVITNKQGQQRHREFIILRKDVKEGGDQKYYVYFLRPADVREMVYMVHKHADIKKDDDRWLYLPSLDLVKRIAAGDKRTSFVSSDFSTRMFQAEVWRKISTN